MQQQGTSKHKALMIVFRLRIDPHRSQLKQNVTPAGQLFVFSDTLGLQYLRNGRHDITNVTTEYPSVVKLVNRYFRENVCFDGLRVGYFHIG